jgi:hypothetical protein
MINVGNDGKITDFFDVDHDLLCNLKRAEMALFKPCYTTISGEIPHLMMDQVKDSRSFSSFNLPLVRILFSKLRVIAQIFQILQIKRS